MSNLANLLLIVSVLLVTISTTYGCGRSCPPRDTTPPTLTCPPNIHVYNKPLQNHQYVTWDEPIARDGSTTIIPRRVGPRPGQLFSGVTRITYSATDRSGNPAYCSFTITVEVLTCPSLRHQYNGFAWCHPSWEMRYGGSCQFGCYAGFQLIGASRANCLETRQWDVSQPVCRKKTCPVLVPPSNVREITCSDTNYYRSICSYNCIEGYGIPQGTSKVRVCNAHGVWNGREPVCVDVTPPEFTICPYVVTGYTEATKTSGRVAWNTPTATDNSGQVTVTKTSGPDVAEELDAGEHEVVYTATDGVGNTATCVFNVVIKQLRCLAIYPLPYTTVTCPNGHIYGSTCTFGCDEGTELNGTVSTKCDKVTRNTIAFGKWNHGSIQPYCYLSVFCPDLIPPNFGAVACDTWMSGVFCRMFCQAGYLALDSDAHSRHHTCSNGEWSYGPELPDCFYIAPNTREYEFYYIDLLYHYYNGTCSEDHNEIRESFLQIFPPDVGNGCETTGGCTVEDVRVICGTTNENVSRKKRQTDGITFQVEMRVSDNMTLTEKLNYRNQMIDKLNSETYGFTILDTEFYGADVVVGMPARQCDNGSIYDKHSGLCVQCKSGYYHDVSSVNCTKCPKGSYQPLSGSESCITCPSGQTTRVAGAVNDTACVEACTPGSYSTYGTVPCSLCDVGTYTDVYATTACAICPGSTTTLVPGASSITTCTDLDIQYVNHTDDEEFVPAVISVNTTSTNSSLVLWFYFNPQVCTSIVNITSGDDVLFQLTNGEDGLVAAVPGQTFIDPYEMTSNTWHYIHVSLQDSRLEMTINDNSVFNEFVPEFGHMWVPDVVNVTLGGLDCIGSFSQFHLNKTNGSSQESRSSCSSDHGGDLLSWKQFLEDGEDGTFVKVHSLCDVINNCDSEPCMNGGQCSDLYQNYLCACPVGYSGYSCDVNLDDCQNHACDNDATCVDGNNTYTCECVPGFKGAMCEIKVVDGGWGNWSEYSSCSVSCGNGTKVRTRVCSDPAPDNGGKDCVGDDRETAVCQDRPESDAECVNECTDQPNITNGNMTCNTDTDGETIICTPSCPPGRDFDSDFMVINFTIFCGRNSSYRWNIRNDVNPDMKLPSCQEQEMAQQVTLLHTARYLELNKDSINDNGVKIGQAIDDVIDHHSCIISGQCAVTTILDDGYTLARKRRSTIGVTFTVNVTCDPIDTVDECYDHLANISAILNASIATQSLTVTYNGVNYDVEHNSTSLDGYATCDRPGTVSVFYYCIPCGLGMYQSGDFCDQCPIGTYQDEIRQVSCKQCPDGWITPGIQSSNVTDCSVPQNEDITETILVMALLIAGGVLLAGIAIIVACVCYKKNTDKNRPVTPTNEPPPDYELSTIKRPAKDHGMSFDNDIDADEIFRYDRNGRTEFRLETLSYPPSYTDQRKNSAVGGPDDWMDKPEVRKAWYN